MDQEFLGWLFTALFTPVAATLWAVWQKALKKVEALQDKRLEDEVTHGTVTREQEARHGQNRLQDATRYAEALEAQIGTLERAVDALAMIENQGEALQENNVLMNKHLATLEVCKASLETIQVKQAHIQDMITAALAR